MAKLRYKLFWKSNGEEKEICPIQWDEKEIDYYSFVKENLDKGYHQISITCEMMLSLIEQVAPLSNIRVTSIEMMEDDCEECERINSLLDETIINRGLIIEVIKTLKYLEDESSIEIKRMSLAEDNKNTAFIQVNGLLGASDKDMRTIQEIISLVKGYINL